MLGAHGIEPRAMCFCPKPRYIYFSKKLLCIYDLLKFGSLFLKYSQNFIFWGRNYCYFETRLSYFLRCFLTSMMAVLFDLLSPIT